LRGKNRRYTSDTIGEGRWLSTVREFLGMAWTFSMVCVAWVFFRAENVGEAVDYISRALNPIFLIQRPQFVSGTALVYVATLLIGDWFRRDGQMPQWWFSKQILPIRWSIRILGFGFILKNFVVQADFIYFQF